MFKRSFIHGLVAAVIASIAAAIYNRIYFFATETDFSKIINYSTIIGGSLLVCMVATFACFGLEKWLGKKKGEIVFNFLFSISSFVLVMIPISFSLPLDIKSPEIFPGLAVPMMFFPAIAWYTVRPIFSASN